MTILVLTDEFDVHADRVIEVLERLGASYFRLNLDVASLEVSLLTLHSDGFAIKNQHGMLESRDISAVWARRLTVSESLEQKTKTQEIDFQIWKGEWNRHLFGCYALIREVFWMNPIAESGLVDNKILQMKRAAECGFKIPPYICSNDRSELVNFLHLHGDCAVKFLSQDTYRSGDGEFVGLYVNKVGADDMHAFSNLNENPILLQKYIDKSYEVRYTVVGVKHFVCKIESQRSAIASIDWRRYDLPSTPHSVIESPGFVKEMVHILMDYFGITYGAIDFIVDRRGDWWYLEVNSAGQWLWIEDLTGLPISDAVAMALMVRG